LHLGGPIGDIWLLYGTKIELGRVYKFSKREGA
jgi:hypothetical protein